MGFAPRTQAWLATLALSSIPLLALAQTGTPERKPIPAAAPQPVVTPMAQAPGFQILPPLVPLAPGEQAVRRPQTAEEKALAAILLDGETRVKDLAGRLAGLADDAARLDLQRQIIDTKRQTRLHLLEARADFARQRGDLAAVREIESAIDNFLNPRIGTTAVSGATKDAAVQNGGR